MSLSFLRRLYEGKEAHEVRMLEAVEGLGGQQARSMMTVLIKSSADQEIAQKTAGTMVFKWHN